MNPEDRKDEGLGQHSSAHNELPFSSPRGSADAEPPGSNADSGKIPGDEVIEDEEAFQTPNIITVEPIRDEADEPFVFRFQLGPAILQQLLGKLETLDPMPLSDALAARHPGFYQLYLDDQPVYIGKTARTIGERLKEHVRKLRGRIAITRMTCRFAYVEDPSLVDISEGTLIHFFDRIRSADWNMSGFGSKVTGYGRGGQSTSQWGDVYPPDLEHLVSAGSSDKELTLKQIVLQIGRGAPITFSLPVKYRNAFDKDHPASLAHPETEKPFSEWVSWVESRLESGWNIERTDTGYYVSRK